MIAQCCIPRPSLPSPWAPPFPWCDPELERLRRLQRDRQVEEEKQRLREWLSRHGLPRTATGWPSPVLPLTPLNPCCPPRSVGDVLEKLR